MTSVHAGLKQPKTKGLVSSDLKPVIITDIIKPLHKFAEFFFKAYLGTLLLIWY